MRDLLADGTATALAAICRLLEQEDLVIDAPTQTAMVENHLSQGVTLALELSGSISGTMLFTFDDASAHALTFYLLRHTTSPDFQSLKESALLEMANIAACAFWQRIDATVPGAYIPGVPSFVPSLTREPPTAGDNLSAAVHFGVKNKGWAGRLILYLDTARAIPLLEKFAAS